MNFKDQNHFLNYIYFIFIHLANKAYQITVKTPDVVHFEFLDLSQFLRPHPNRFYYSGTWRKIRHALLGNNAHTYARTPLKWGSQNYTLCPSWNRHVARFQEMLTLYWKKGICIKTFYLVTCYELCGKGKSPTLSLVGPSHKVSR